MTETPAVPAAPVPAHLISSSTRPWAVVVFTIVLGCVFAGLWSIGSYAQWTSSWRCGFFGALVVSFLYFGQDIATRVTQSGHPNWSKVIGVSTAFIVGIIEIGILATNVLNFKDYFMGIASALCAGAFFALLFTLSWLSAKTRSER